MVGGLYDVAVCVTVCVPCVSVCALAFVHERTCVCVWGGGGGCTNQHLGEILCFNRISADTRAVGTSPVVKPMPINVLSIFLTH